MIPLSPETKRKLARVFREEDRAEAERILVNECADNLPFYEDTDEYRLERIRFAVLKLSKGDLEKLAHWVHEAQMDWRDVLMAAGFGSDVRAHERWKPGETLR